MKGTLSVSIDHCPQQSAGGSDFAGGVSCGDGCECGQGLDAAEYAAGLSPGILRDAEFCTDVKTSLQQIVPCGEVVPQQRSECRRDCDDEMRGQRISAQCGALLATFSPALVQVGGIG